MLGYKQDELRSLAYPSSGRMKKSRNSFLATLEKEHKISDTGIELSKKDHTTIWALVTASLGKDSAVICSIIDISERKRLNDILDESELRYRTLFDFACDAILIHDLDGRIFEANRAAVDLFGMPGEKLVTMTLPNLDRDGVRQHTVRLDPGPSHTGNNFC